MHDSIGEFHWVDIDSLSAVVRGTPLIVPKMKGCKARQEIDGEHLDNFLELFFFPGRKIYLTFSPFP